ncbi:9136_t:CDS:2 [Paraglomus brasilianum]|uniref:9136_t:CDS:1 n=1 Tax=Paraglomus brasilianum TaxID=144538 RepID=A0A9N8ZMQ8_9GLOM|nr:9136_t:CDS:2 [Paraglomus brasilianum]
MNFEENIATYFGSTQYPQWSVMGILQYLAEYMDYTSNSKEEISKVLAKHLLHISVGINFKKSAKNKAKKLYAALDTTLSRAEIIQFFDEQDVRFYKKLYKINVEKSVIKDKIFVVKAESTRFFGKSEPVIESNNHPTVPEELNLQVLEKDNDIVLDDNSDEFEDDD